MRAIVLGALLVGSGCKPLHTALQPNPTPVQQRVLEYTSGLRVIAEQHPGTGRVALALLIGAGSTSDPQGREGAAHFVEHLAFRSRPAQRLSLWDELDFAGVAGDGATVNAYTTFDTTSFLGLVPADKLAAALPLFTSLAVRPLVGVDDATLEVERAVLRNEQLERGHGGGQFLAAVGTAVFGAGAAGSRPISGDARSIAAITRADLEGFVTQNYVPSGTTLVLVGDVSPDQVDALVRRSFPPAWLETHTRVAPRTLVPHSARAGTSQQRPVVEGDVTGRELVFAWAVPGSESTAGSAMALFQNEFRRPRSSVEKELGVKSMWASFLPMPSESIVLLGVELEPGADLEKVRAEFVKKGEFWKPDQNDARRLAIDELRREQDLVTHAASRASRAFVTGQTGLKRLGVNEEGWKELERVRTQLLTFDRAREVLVVPRVATLDAAPRVQAVSNTPRNVTVSPESLRAVALPLPLGDVRSFTLENGLRVVLSKRGPVPYASATLTLPLGARFGSRVTREALPVMMDFKLRRHASFSKVGEPDVNIGADATTLTLSGPSWELPVMLDVLGHNLPPEVPWDRVLVVEYIVQTWLEKKEERPAKDPRLSESREPLLREVLPAGSRQLDLVDDELKDLERAQFVEFVDRAFVPQGAALVLTGDFEFEPTEAIVRELFSDWRGRLELPKPRVLGAPPRRPEAPRVVDVPEATQTEVRFACRLPPAATLEQRGGQELLAQALAQVFEDDLRRERGATYGVQAWTTGYRGEPNVLWLEAKLDARERQATLARFFERLDELDGAVWEEQTIDRARWRLARASLGTALTSKEASVVLGQALVAGQPLDDAKDLAWKLSTAPLRTVDDAWADCFESAALELRGHRPTIDAVLKRRAQNGKP